MADYDFNEFDREVRKFFAAFPKAGATEDQIEVYLEDLAEIADHAFDDLKQALIRLRRQASRGAGDLPGVGEIFNEVNAIRAERAVARDSEETRQRYLLSANNGGEMRFNELPGPIQSSIAESLRKLGYRGDPERAIKYLGAIGTRFQESDKKPKRK